jgi:2'-5' RNA ligase
MSQHEPSQPDTLRAFLALEPSAEARAAAARAQGRLRAELAGRELRWTAPESFHATLRFLGAISRPQAAEIASAVERAIAPLPEFDLALGELSAFPDLRRPRVWVIGLLPTAPAQQLERMISSVLEPLGFELESRAFTPHLTLARTRPGSRPRAAAVLPPVEPVAFRVRDVVLFESRLSHDRARYTPVARMALAASTLGEQISPTLEEERVHVRT